MNGCSAVGLSKMDVGGEVLMEPLRVKHGLTGEEKQRLAVCHAEAVGGSLQILEDSI